MLRATFTSLVFSCIYILLAAMGRFVAVGRPGLPQTGEIVGVAIGLVLIGFSRNVLQLVLAVASYALLWFILPPFGSMRVALTPDNVTALIVFPIDTAVFIFYSNRLQKQWLRERRQPVASGDSFLC
jgi:hypothetical protein